MNNCSRRAPTEWLVPRADSTRSVSATMPHGGPGGADRVGDSDAHKITDVLEIPGDLCRHLFFAAEQMGAAGEVEKEGAGLVGLFEANQGTVARAPAGEQLQQLPVGLGIVRSDVWRSAPAILNGRGTNTGTEQRLGFGKRHAGANAGGDGDPRAVAHLVPSTPAARRGRRAQHDRTPRT